MAAGLRQGLAGEEQAGPLDQAGLDRHREAVVGAARVAHRREAALQSAFQDLSGVLVDQRARHEVETADIGVRRQGVEVGVD